MPVTDEPAILSIAVRVCIVVALAANGLISRIDEYFDPREIKPLF